MAESNQHYMSKVAIALQDLQHAPQRWFRQTSLEARDLDLITAMPVPWLKYQGRSYLRKICHKKKGEEFEQTDWVVEADDKCKKLVDSAGATLVGFDLSTTILVHWESVTVNVNVTGTCSSGFKWGFLSTSPDKIRVYKGPPGTCESHPWDAMVLRDCTANTSSLEEVESIASRKWDVLAMKICEDYDYPWVVITIKDAGLWEPLAHRNSQEEQFPCGCSIA